MEDLSQKTRVKIPENLKEIKNKKIRHFEACEVNEMEGFVAKASNKRINEVKND
jgi:threonine synthase